MGGSSAEESAAIVSSAGLGGDAREEGATAIGALGLRLHRWLGAGVLCALGEASKTPEVGDATSSSMTKMFEGLMSR